MNQLYVSIGDTIPLLLCSDISGKWNNINETHWTVTKDNQEVIFENRNQSSFFIVPDSGYYAVNTNSSGWSSLTFRTSLKISIYSTDHIPSPYEVTLQDTLGTILGVDTLYGTSLNFEEVQCDDPKNANFEVYEGATFLAYGENINDSNDHWSKDVIYHSGTLHCLKVEIP